MITKAETSINNLEDLFLLLRNKFEKIKDFFEYTNQITLVIKSNGELNVCNIQLIDKTVMKETHRAIWIIDNYEDVLNSSYRSVSYKENIKIKDLIFYEDKYLGIKVSFTMNHNKLMFKYATLHSYHHYKFNKMVKPYFNISFHDVHDKDKKSDEMMKTMHNSILISIDNNMGVLNHEEIDEIYLKFRYNIPHFDYDWQFNDVNIIVL